MHHFEGKTAIVTGAGSGIGLGLARTFARLGMSVVLCDVRKDRLEAALAEVRGLGARAVAVPTDVSNRASVRNAADEAVKAFGALHIACNNAGVTIHGRSIADLGPPEWDWVIGVNLYGVETKDWLLARHRRIIDAFDDCERWNSERSGRDTAPVVPDGTHV